MGIKIAVLICSLGIALLSIEWKAWKTHLLRNIILGVFFLFALIFGIKDIKEQSTKDAQAIKDKTYLRHSVDFTNKELLAARKDINTMEDTLNNVLHILEHNKISFNFRSNNIFIGAGFYKMHPDPELNDKLQAINNSLKPPSPIIKQNEPKKSKPDEMVRKARLEGYLKDYDGEKTRFIVDSTRRSKYDNTDPVYKQITGYMNGDKKLMRQYQDSVRKYK
jgi:hypothetical protein